ncbi:LytR/AlgR family response regulator transcription factor [Enterococcus sp. AZ072]|uniref:LytR/AlgR family response regulator transcription factor n=1 Tax=unclassified Enterococcus TaxID=2608891 RepID=UPI003D26E6D1
MNIAICDDDLFFCDQIEQCLEDLFQKTCTSEVFTSGDELLAYIQRHASYFQIYLLDIEMRGTNGVDTAKKIRELDLDALIIFVTSHKEWVLEAFDVTAFHYVIKPLNKEKFSSILLSAEKFFMKQRKLFHFVVRKQLKTLPITQIEYLESTGRKIRVFTTDKECHEYYGTLKEAEEKLDLSTFARIHQSYLLNMNYIDVLEEKIVVMKNKNRLPISKRLRSSFLKQYRNYLRMMGNTSFKGGEGNAS